MKFYSRFPFKQHFHSIGRGDYRGAHYKPYAPHGTFSYKRPFPEAPSEFNKRMKYFGDILDSEIASHVPYGHFDTLEQEEFEERALSISHDPIRLRMHFADQREKRKRKGVPEKPRKRPPPALNLFLDPPAPEKSNTDLVESVLRSSPNSGVFPLGGSLVGENYRGPGNTDFTLPITSTGDAIAARHDVLYTLKSLGLTTRTVSSIDFEAARQFIEKSNLDRSFIQAWLNEVSATAMMAKGAVEYIMENLFGRNIYPSVSSDSDSVPFIELLPEEIEELKLDVERGVFDLDIDFSIGESPLIQLAKNYERAKKRKAREEEIIREEKRRHEKRSGKRSRKDVELAEKKAELERSRIATQNYLEEIFKMWKRPKIE